MNRAFIFIGTNIDREKNYLEAVRRLARVGKLVCVSSLYRTAPIGGEGEDFLNGAVLLETRLTAHELKQALGQLEAAMGRVRTNDRNAPRTIDLDLVLYNREALDDGQVRVPDPLILKRPFLAQTLAELAPDYVHPTDGRTLAEIAVQQSKADGMWLEPGMTARVHRLFDEIHSGEMAHA